MRRRCEFCGRKFRYPGFSFDAVHPSLMDHVNWGHTFLLLGRLPGSEEQKRSYRAVYEEASRSGDGSIVRAMLENATQDPELYESLTGEPIDAQASRAPEVYGASTAGAERGDWLSQLGVTSDRGSATDVSMAADYMERLHSYEVRGDPADHPSEVASAYSAEEGTLLGQILAACAVAVDERIKVEGIETVRGELDSRAEIYSYDRQRVGRQMRQAQLLLRRYMDLGDPPHPFGFTPEEMKIGEEDARGVVISLASIALNSVKETASREGVPANDAVAGFIHVLRMQSIDSSIGAAARSTPLLKTCPRCAESVKEAAQVCRFCGHEFA